jgi:peptide/nickel transport system permease protein
VFNLPGAGRLLLQSVLRRDYPVIQGAVLCVALLYAVVNLCVDLAYAWIDPRVRYA